MKYQEACNAPRTKLVEDRLACLRGVRDETVVVRYMLRDADRRVLEDLNLVGVLPNLALCSSATPIAPPEVPRSQPRRGNALAVLARAVTLRWQPETALAGATASSSPMRHRPIQTYVGWKPLTTRPCIAPPFANARGRAAARGRTLRSLPRDASDRVELVVEPTHATAGTVRGARPLVDATASYAGATYVVHAAIGKDGAYRLGGLPRGGTLGLQGPAGDGTRRTQKQWPAGPAVEVIVRARDVPASAAAFVFRGKVAPRTRAEADGIAGDVATASFRPIGAGATAAGRETYEPGDQHALVLGNAAVEVTVCVTLSDLPQTPATCAALIVDDDPALVLPVLFKTGP